MTIDDITDYVASLGDVVTSRPGPEDGSPPISWGDVFFYYAPDGQIPPGQPFATIVTKDYPDDRGSQLDRRGAFRVNIGVGTARFTEIAGHAPRHADQLEVDPSAADVLFPHPVYGTMGWLSAVNPAERTSGLVLELLGAAHGAAAARYQRRLDTDTDTDTHTDTGAGSA